MSRFEHITEASLHHAYLIEGDSALVLKDLLPFIENLGVHTSNNPDFNYISIDNFKMDEALSLRTMGTEKSFTDNRKIFVVSAHTFSLDAQQALLKLFEEPIYNTHFFVIVPEVDALIKTLVSRFFVIQDKSVGDAKGVHAFIASPYAKRIEYIKELLTQDDEDDIQADSARTKALAFLSSLEQALYAKLSEVGLNNSGAFFNHIFKVREYMRQPGSAPKTLLESVALTIPVLQ